MQLTQRQAEFLRSIDTPAALDKLAAKEARIIDAAKSGAGVDAIKAAMKD